MILQNDQLESFRSDFQRITVEDVPVGFNKTLGLTGQSGIRTLLTDTLYQSAVRIMYGKPDATAAPVFRYIRGLDLIHWYRPNPKSILYLGLGAGVAPTRAKHFSPDTNIQVVELDPKILSTAIKWFNFDLDKIPVDIQDAQSWLENSDRLFEVIVVDLFFGGELPDRLADLEFAELIYKHLAQDGIVVVNFIGPLEGEGSEVTLERIENYQDTFKNVAVYPIDNGRLDERRLDSPYLNTLIFCSDGPLPDISQIRSVGGVEEDFHLRKILRDRFRFFP